MAPITLCYWNIRGCAEPIRLLLHQAGVEFEDKRMDFTGPPDYGFGEWFAKKDKLGLDFPNLPYYIEGDRNVTQSLAIIRYLAKKHGLCPKDELDTVRADTLEQLSRDIIISMFFIMNVASVPEAQRGIFKEKTEGLLQQVSSFLGENDWLIGGELSYVDFLMYESVDHYSYFKTDTYVKYPKLAAFAKRVESLPRIKAYMNGAAHKAWPLYGPIAPFGGGGEPPVRNLPK